MSRATKTGAKSSRAAARSTASLAPPDGYFYFARLQEICRDTGVLLIVRAFWEATGIAPPLCVTRAAIDEIVAILGESYEAIQADFPV